VFKKPLIETELNVRFNYIRYLVPFLNAFKEHLRSVRILTEDGPDAIPF
jgi:uncharacterized protein YnzC (UPF0291/DUF896 family)